MNIAPINYNQKNYAVNSPKQNVQFKAAKGAPLVTFLEKNHGNFNEEQMIDFIKKNCSPFSRKMIIKFLKGFLPYITGLTATSAGLLAANKALEKDNTSLQAQYNTLLAEKNTFENEYKGVLESKNIKNIEPNKNSLVFEYNDVKYRMDREPNVNMSMQKILLDVMDGKEIPEGVKIVEVKTSSLPPVDTIEIKDYFESYIPTVRDIERSGCSGRDSVIEKHNASLNSFAGGYRCFLTYKYNGKTVQINDYFAGKDNKSSLKHKAIYEVQKQINDNIKSLEANTEGNFAKMFRK